ncbi:MAG: transglycosylase SLT domain-containing protein [Salinibacterium sp.]|nr:transglycosylase SLT domain-containing protein [Salinibacterium sp.]
MRSWYLAGCAWWDGLVNRLPIVGAIVLVLAGCAASPALPAATQAGPPPLAASPAGPGYTDMVDHDWAQRTAEATGIPVLAVLAYAGAAIRAAEVYPDCGIGWNTLAAIALVESDHGSFGGSSIGADFTVSPPIFGAVLDGGDTEHIPDSDGGLVDGIKDFDRAVGPMQLIPQTWASWPSDGNGDGVGDPQNIADAAIAAANHMCRASGGMSTDDGWRRGIAAYNSGVDYLRKVATAAQQYVDQAG